MTPRIGFIGAGRVGTVLALAFQHAGFEVSGVWSRRAESAKVLGQRLGVPEPARPTAQTLADGSDLVFLTVSDDAIAHVAGSVAWRPGQCVVHCSGALEVPDALAPALAAGACIGGFHPLQTFSSVETALARLPGTSVAVEAADPALAELLRSMAVGVGARPFMLPAGGRALYHASASFVAGGVVALFQEAIDCWADLGLGADAARRALLPLLEGTTATLAAEPTPALALSGPIARGDVGTVRRHLEALAPYPPSRDLYRAVGERCVRLARQKGTLSAAQAAEIGALLAAPPPPLARPQGGTP